MPFLAIRAAAVAVADAVVVVCVTACVCPQHINMHLNWHTNQNNPSAQTVQSSLRSATPLSFCFDLRTKNSLIPSPPLRFAKSPNMKLLPNSAIWTPQTLFPENQMWWSVLGWSDSSSHLEPKVLQLPPDTTASTESFPTT